MYDWANSAFMTVIVTAVFPIYYSAVAAANLDESTATAYYAAASALGLLAVAIVAPPLGALADAKGRRKNFLAGFALLGILSTAALFFVHEGDWQLALACFAIGNLGAGASTIFYDSLLAHIAEPEDLDRVSTAGFALGYIGGGVLLALSLAWITSPLTFGLPGASSPGGSIGPRLSFLATAIWWLVFSLPLLRKVPEPPATGGGSTIMGSFLGMAKTFAEIRRFPQAFLLLLAFFIYNDGILTIIRMATIYGKGVGLDSGQMIFAVLLVQFVGVPCSFLFGGLASKIGSKVAIGLGLGVYLLVALLGYSMKTATDFYLLAGLVALVQGGTQALSRSLFASLIPRQKSAEFFGFYAVGEKFAGVLGPTLFATVLFAGESSKDAMLWLMLFFIVGGFLLSKVNVEEGRRQAREAESSIR
jgi:MFS transporter, UMF1 family